MNVNCLCCFLSAVQLAKQSPTGKLAESVAGVLMNLVVPDDGDAKQRFVTAGGIEAACKV